MFNLASMFVDIKAKTDPFDAAIDRLHANAIKRGALIGSVLGGAFTSALGVALQAMGGAFNAVVTGSSDLAETLSKTGQVFGPAADVVIGQTDQMSDAFGLSKTKMLDAASMFGLMAKGAGMSGDAVAGFSNDLVKLAADASSFYNVPMDQALEKIRAGLSGESEPLRAFGVFLSEDAVKAKALAMGLVQSGQALSEQQKIMARSALIAQGLGTATGDLERTQDGFANQSRKLTGSLTNLAASVGTALMPAFQGIVSVGNRFVDGLVSGFTAAAPYVETGARMVGDAINLLADFYVSGMEATRLFAADLMSTPVFKFLADSFNEAGGWVEYFRDVASEAFSTVAVLMRNQGATYEMVKIQLQTFVENAGIGFSTMMQNAAILGTWLGDNWLNMVADAANGVTTVFMNLGKNIKGLWDAILKYLSGGEWEFDYTPLLDGFKAMTAKVPELIEPMWVDASGRMAKVQDEVARRESDRAQAGKAKKPDAAGNGMAKAGEQMAGMSNQFKSQSFAASDFARDLSGKQFGKDPAAIAQAQLDEQKKAREASERTADATEKLAKATPAALFA